MTDTLSTTDTAAAIDTAQPITPIVPPIPPAPTGDLEAILSNLVTRVDAMETDVKGIVAAANDHFSKFDARILAAKTDVQAMAARVDTTVIDIEARFTSILKTVGATISTAHDRLAALEAGARGLFATLFGRKAKA